MCSTSSGLHSYSYCTVGLCNNLFIDVGTTLNINLAEDGTTLRLQNFPSHLEVLPGLCVPHLLSFVNPFPSFFIILFLLFCAFCVWFWIASVYVKSRRNILNGGKIAPESAVSSVFTSGMYFSLKQLFSFLSHLVLHILYHFFVSPRDVPIQIARDGILWNVINISVKYFAFAHFFQRFVTTTCFIAIGSI